MRDEGDYEEDHEPTGDPNPVIKVKKRKTAALNPDDPNQEAAVVKKKKKKPKEPEKKPERIVFNVFNTQYDIIKDTGKRDFNWKLSHKDPWYT